MIKYISIIILLSSCASKFVPTTDICTIRKHYKDNLYNIYLNDSNYNKKWYLQKDAIRRIGLLEERNICNRGNPIDITEY